MRVCFNTLGDNREPQVGGQPNGGSANRTMYPAGASPSKCRKF